MIKHATQRSIVESGVDWEDVLPMVLYGNRRCNRGPTPSPFRLMYGINPRMFPCEAVALLADAVPH